jgi:hypothetical protein
MLHRSTALHVLQYLYRCVACNVVFTHTGLPPLVTQEARNTAAASLAAKLAEHQKQWEESRTDDAAAANENGFSGKQTSEDRIKYALRNCSPHMVSGMPTRNPPLCVMNAQCCLEG